MAAIKTAKGLVLGYNAPKSHNITNIHQCLVLHPLLDQKIQALRPYLPRLLPDKNPCDITLQYAGGAFDMVLTGPFSSGYEFDSTLAEMAEALNIARISLREKDTQTPQAVLTRAPVIKKFGTLSVTLPPAAFLQASDEGEKALSTIVAHHAANAKNIADLFCGCGTFTGVLPGNVTAFDGDAAAVAALKKAGAASHHRNLFKNPLRKGELKDFDCVIVDPPRAGAKEQMQELAGAGVPRVISVSCNPATFCRDAKILMEGGYRLNSLTLVDQFVFSNHAEVVGLFIL